MSGVRQNHADVIGRFNEYFPNTLVIRQYMTSLLLITGTILGEGENSCVGEGSIPRKPLYEIYLSRYLVH